tara:strand:- start:236 stop:478 length:243 start_codon:yes stop_codon:yes gene_type:complete
MGKSKKDIHVKNCNYIAMRYCFKKGFRIYPKVFGSKFKVFYSLGANQGQFYMKGQEFTKEQSFQAIWDLYAKIYEHDKNK